MCAVDMCIARHMEHIANLGVTQAPEVLAQLPWLCGCWAQPAGGELLRSFSQRPLILSKSRAGNLHCELWLKGLPLWNLL